MTNKIILDLCGGTGAWSVPYKENGYDVRNITLPEYDVRKYVTTKDGITFDGENWIEFKDIYGILAAPPCTMFSFARTKAKKPRDLEGGMQIIIACLDVVWQCQARVISDQQKYSPLKFWALENPYYAMTKWFLGKPAFIFQPYEFGHNYQKKTALWGMFNEPKKNPIKMTKKQKELAKTNSQPMPKFDYMKSKDIAPDWFGKLDRKARRAITPRGFAEAFYKANR